MQEGPEAWGSYLRDEKVSLVLSLHLLFFFFFSVYISTTESFVRNHRFYLRFQYFGFRVSREKYRKRTHSLEKYFSMRQIGSLHSWVRRINILNPLWRTFVPRQRRDPNGDGAVAEAAARWQRECEVVCWDTKDLPFPLALKPQFMWVLPRICQLLRPREGGQMQGVRMRDAGSVR